MIRKCLVPMFLLFITAPVNAGQFLLDFGDLSGTAAGWDLVTGDVLAAPITDQSGSGDNDVTLTVTGIGGQNNPSGMGATAVNGILVPAEVNDDYLWGAGGPGSEALFEIQNLDAGLYDVSVFAGRTDDSNGQLGRIWAGVIGDDPGAENTGDFAGGSSTLSVTIGAGDSLFYVHQEDDRGGTSGLIVTDFILTPGDYNDDGSINTIDAGILRDNLGLGTDPVGGLAAFADGDEDGDGDVDLDDFGLFKEILAQQPLSTLTATVPEPSSFLLSMSALAGIAVVARRRSHRA